MVAFGVAGQEVPSQKKNYVRTGEEASISGKVILSGERPKPTVIDMTADPGCYQNNPRPKTEWYEGRSGGLANVLVYVASRTLESYVFETPTSPVVWDQKGCRYVPRVLGMQLGQTLRIMNSDSIQNNVHPTPKFNPEWNQTQPAGSPPLLKILRHAEVAIPFKDNQHPWKKGYFSVFAHPFFAVTDMEGNYRIEGLPPGFYKVTAWHEKLGEKAFDLLVAPGESRHFSFTFSAAEASGKVLPGRAKKVGDAPTETDKFIGPDSAKTSAKHAKIKYGGRAQIISNTLPHSSGVFLANSAALGVLAVSLFLTYFFAQMKC